MLLQRAMLNQYKILTLGVLHCTTIFNGAKRIAVVDILV